MILATFLYIAYAYNEIFTRPNGIFTHLGRVDVDFFLLSRCSWSSANRRCSNYIWMINNFIVHKCASYIRGLNAWRLEADTLITKTINSVKKNLQIMPSRPLQETFSDQWSETPGSHCWHYYPGTLSSSSSHNHPFKDLVQYGFHLWVALHWYQSFKWSDFTEWFSASLFHVMATRMTHFIIKSKNWP